MQTLTITDWHPTMSANGSHGHWRTHQKKHDVDRDMAWAAARQANWEFVPGKVHLTVTLVYPRKYRVDADNLAARCKGLIDGLKGRSSLNGVRATMIVNGQLQPAFGFFTDDSTEWLDLVVRAEVVKGVKATRLELRAV